MAKNPLPPKPVLPEIWFDMNQDTYWLRREGQGFFTKLGERKVKRHLLFSGMENMDRSDGLTTIEHHLTKTEIDRSVDYSGPLAGHKPGVFNSSDGKRVLVTSGPNPAVWEKPTSKTRDCPFIENYLSALLGPEQMLHAMRWHALAVRALRRGDFRPGQMLVLAGASTCGKSFFHVLTTELLGGRMAKPYDWMSGKTPFNADIAGAESLVIEDGQSKISTSARRAFGESMKTLTVNESFYLHGKGKTAAVLPTFKRLHLSVNHEPEPLQILPVLYESNLQKMSLLHCRDATGFLSDDRKENRERLAEEMPAYRALLETHSKVPARLVDPRFGLASIHSPELMEIMNEMSEESRLAEFIDKVLFAKAKRGEAEPSDTWRGTATELEERLRKSAFDWAVDRLLDYPSACGVFLSRLAMKFPNRYESRKSEGKKEWIVRAP